MASFTEIKHDRSKEEGEDSYAYAKQLVLSVVLPMSLREATELGVFEIIAKAGEGAKISASEIAAQLNCRNPDAPMMLDRILRLLVSHCVLEYSVVSGVGLYSLAPVSKYFVRNQDGAHLGAVLALITDKVFLDSWSQLKEAILGGGVSFDRVHGTHAFEYPGLDPRFNEVFNTAMYNHTTIIIKNIVEVYRGFDNIKQLVDVGGGLGIALKIITSKYPHIKGINLDVPHVIQHAPDYPGVEHVEGDMFESVPKGDATFMKGILHDWSDEYCLKLLKNCYQSIPQDGKIIVVEAILPEIPETSAASKGNFQSDVLMMTQHHGGKERTKDEFMRLAIGAGFSGIRYECFVCNLWVMELYK